MAHHEPHGMLALLNERNESDLECEDEKRGPGDRMGRALEGHPGSGSGQDSVGCQMIGVNSRFLTFTVYHRISKWQRPTRWVVEDCWK